MRWLWLPVALAAQACTCGGDVCTGTGALPPPTGFDTTFQTVKVTVLQPSSCGSRVPTSVIASVLGPDTLSVPGVSATGPTISSDGFTAEVSFVPTQPGSHHVTVRFEPSFGVGQTDVIIGAERRDAGALAVDRACQRADLTPGGLLLCTLGGEVQVLRGETLVQSFGGLVARAAGTVWVSPDGGQLERWVEDGGSFGLTTSAATPRIVAITPSPLDAVVVTATGDTLWWVDGGFVDAGVKAPSDNVVWRDGDELVYVTSRALGSPMGGWCVHDMVDGGDRCSSETVSPQVAGTSVDPSGIWVESKIAMTGGFELFRFDAHAFDHLVLPSGTRVLAPLPIAYDRGVLLAPDAGVPLVVVSTPHGLVLENYGPDVRSVTSSAVTVGDGAGVRVFRR